MKPDPSKYDVIIAGAGPVGLFLACELALAKCSVLILEKSENPHSLLKKIPFGIRGLSAPSIEAFYRRGLLDKFNLHKQVKSPHMNSGQGTRRQVGHFAGIPLHEDDIDTSQWKYRLPSSTPASLISEMDEIETILTHHAETLNIEIKYGHPVSSVQQDKTITTVQAGEIIFQALWVVGCDGARSMVRKAGSFEFAGTEPYFTGYSTYIEIADPEKLKSGRVMTEQGMYLQSQPGYVVIQDFDGGAFHGSDRPLTLEHIQKVLRRVSNTDVTIKTLHTATTWTDRARQATSYRNGRILLAGDAAHIHSPLGGQGLNLGLGDALNLGWKLAATIKKTAPEGLIDSYHLERHPIGEKVIAWSRAQVAIMNPTPEARALNAIFRDIMNTRDGATYVAGRIWGLLTRYDLDSGHSLIGCSVPNFEFMDGTKLGEFMHDGHGVLLDFHSNKSLEKIADEHSTQLKYISAVAKEQFGLNALLIRPDGIVAWVAEGPVDELLLQKSMARWFTKE